MATDRVAHSMRRNGCSHSPNHVDKLPHRQVLHVSAGSGQNTPPTASVEWASEARPRLSRDRKMFGHRRLTAGTRYFFLSIVGMSLFSAFSQMTWRELSQHAGAMSLRGSCLDTSVGSAPPRPCVCLALSALACVLSRWTIAQHGRARMGGRESTYRRGARP